MFRILVFSLLVCLTAWSQTSTGNIRGPVEDTSGARVPNAKISGQIIHNHLRERYDAYVFSRSRGPVYPADPAGMEGVRVSTHYYNTFEQVDLV